MSLEAIKASVDSFTTKTTETVAAVSAKVDSTQAAVDRIEAVLKRPGFGTTAANDNNKEDIKAEHSALDIFARSGDDKKLLEVRASMSLGSDPDGGYSVYPALSTTMTTKLYNQSAFRGIARVETMTTGSEWWEPVDNDESGATWVGEQASRPETDTPQIGMLKVPCLEQYALQKITQRLLDDSSWNLGQWIEGKVTDKFARSENSAFVSGTGVIDPRGILTYTNVTTDDSTRAWGELQYIASGAATTVTADALKDTLWSLRAPYRQGANWLLNSNTMNAIDKLKTGDGDYIVRPGMTSGAPDSILGYPVAYSEDMPNLEAGSLSICFGNFKLGYVIVEKPGIKWLRDVYTAKPHVLFYAYRRIGGGVSNSEALKLVRTGA